MTYSLSTSYAGESLLSGFNWHNGTDLSNGFVSYQSRSDAEAQGLYSINTDTDSVRLGVDSTHTYLLSQGRPSIRLESKESYNHGLFIADFLHMPPSQCGVWPAFWAYGTDWPNGGELDIIEGANTAHQNVISAHTSDGCFQDESQAGMFTGAQRNKECHVGSNNIGCGYNPPATDLNSYGDAFNAVNGGVYAMQWDEKHIKVWHFARGQIPADIEAKTPKPEGWGLPQAIFGGNKCDVDSYFKDMSLVININFCGDYGNVLWGISDSCSSFAPTCSEYVANNPEAFVNTYWDVKYIDAYMFDANAIPAPEPTTTTTMTSYSTTFFTVSETESAPSSTSSTPVTKPNDIEKPANPASIGDYSSLGCFSSSSSFPTFYKAIESAEMTLDTCVQLCDSQNALYAGAVDNQCFCADKFDAETRAAEQDQCDKPCSGNKDEVCGGEGLLTVYGAVKHQEAPVPPPMAPVPKEVVGKGSYEIATKTNCHCNTRPAQTELPVPALGRNQTALMKPAVVPTSAAGPKDSPLSLGIVIAVIAVCFMIV